MRQTMISSNIDGTASNPLMSLIDLVSNPDEYKKRVKALQDATAENLKAVALVGDASKITELHAQAEADRKAAADELAQAKDKSSDLVKDAKAKANKVLTDADVRIKKMYEDAIKAKEEADAAKAEAEKLSASLKAEVAAIAKDRESVDALVEAAVAREATAKKEFDEYAKAKADVLAKHQAFLKGL